MSYTEWLRGQVERLESEIRAHSVFDTSNPATLKQLKELRSKTVIHTYLKQQLLRREAVRPQVPRVEDAIEVEIDLPTLLDESPLHEEDDRDIDADQIDFATRELPIPQLRSL